MEAQDLFKLWEQEKNSAERQNFNTLYQAAAEWCNPPCDDITTLKTAGDKKTSQRLIDIGIKARRMFTAGMMSHLFPQGQHWVRIITNDSLMQNDNVKRALAQATRKFMFRIEESNFYEEMGNCIDDCGYIGTTAILCEKSNREPLIFRNYYINSFYFCENYEGKVDTFINDFKLTARQALQQFGDDTPQVIQDMANSVATSGKEYTFVRIIMPRAGYKPGKMQKREKPIAEYYLCCETKEIVREGGYDEIPVSVGRFYKNAREKMGRSCATEVLSSLSMTNRMEVSRIRGAERVSNPPWLSPSDGSVRRISNDQGSIIYWNAGNPLSKPEQLIPSDNVLVNDEMITKKEEEILDAFYVPLFNPLHDRQNMTAYESSQRLDLSLQFLTPAVNRLNRYFVKPILERAFAVLLREGYFPELEIPELSGAKIDFELVGKASLASRQIELFGTMTAMEQMGLIGQVKPEIWDNIDADATARFIQAVNMVPTELQISEDDRNALREQRAQQQQAMQAMQASTVGADAYVKMQKKPEEGSGAEALMEAM